MDRETLQHAPALLRLAERTAFVGTWSLDVASGQLQWSDQLAQVHGAPPGFAPAPGHAFDHYAPEWRADIEQRMRACAQDGTPFDTEMQIETLHGRRIWVESGGPGQGSIFHFTLPAGAGE